MQIWMEVLAMQPGSCQAGSLCLVSGMDKEMILGHFTLITVVLVCFVLTKIKIKYKTNKLGEIMSLHSSVSIRYFFTQ